MIYTFLKQTSPVWFFLLISYGCRYPKIPKYPVRYGDKYSDVAGLTANKGFITQQDIDYGLELKKQYPEGTEYIAGYYHTTFNFSYNTGQANNGHPVSAIQSDREKIISLEEDRSFNKVEYLSEQVELLNSKVSWGDIPNYYHETRSVTKNVEDNGIFYSDAQMHIITSRMPVTGTTLHVGTDVKYKDVKYLTSVYFQESFHMQERIITFNIPSWLQVEILERNFQGYQITRTEEKYTPKEEELVIYNPIDADKDIYDKSLSLTTNPTSYRYITYTMHQVSPVKNTWLSPGSAHNLPHLLILCKKYDQELAMAESGAKKMKTNAKNYEYLKNFNKPSAYTAADTLKSAVDLIDSLPALYKWYHSITQLTKNDTALIASKTRELIKNKNTDADKIKAIYYWVQDNIRYVAFEDGIAAFKPEACQKVYNNKYGDCKGMANLLKQMLQSAGYDARLTWVGTRRIPYDYTIPSVSVDNHMICALFLGGRRYFLDGTEKFIAFDDYAHRIQGRPILIENDSSFYIDTIPDLSPQRNKHEHSGDFTIQGTLLIGQMKEYISGEDKTNLIRDYYYNELKDRENVVKNYLNDQDPDMEIKEINVSDLSNREQPINLSYELTAKNKVLKEGKFLFISPEMSNEFEDHITDSGRVVDISYDHKVFYTYDYNIQIPPGYKVNFIPANVQEDHPEFSITISYALLDGKLVYHKIIQLKTGTISVKNFDSWNKAMRKLKAAYESYIILEKQIP